MSTSPVMSITDEMVADLESELGQIVRIADFVGGVCMLSPSGIGSYLRLASPATILALLAERADLIRDLERLEWMLTEQCIMRVQNGTGSPSVYSLWWSTLSEGQREWYASPRAAIDAAMVKA